jgi:carboxylesterase type B
MYWIFGGGLQFGHAGHPGYDGTRFAAEEDVIIVSVNYRTNGNSISPFLELETVLILAVFGFPSSPDLPLTGHNLGFLDQRLGLDWIQRNIHAFGGDPSKVTVFGESAGAFSIDALLTSYPAKSHPPFRAAILQSGQISYVNPYAMDTTSSWLALAAALNCTDTKSNLTCIRNAPAVTVKSIVEHQALNFFPVEDNVTLIANMARARIERKIAKIPVLSGTNAQESRVIVVGQNNATAYLKGIGVRSEIIPTIEAAYPVGGWEFPEPFDAVAQMATDFAFHCVSLSNFDFLK